MLLSLTYLLLSKKPPCTEFFLPDLNYTPPTLKIATKKGYEMNHHSHRKVCPIACQCSRTLTH